MHNARQHCPIAPSARDSVAAPLRVVPAACPAHTAYYVQFSGRATTIACLWQDPQRQPQPLCTRLRPRLPVSRFPGMLLHILPARLVNQGLIRSRLPLEPGQDIRIQTDSDLLLERSIEFSTLCRTPVGDLRSIWVRQINRLVLQRCELCSGRLIEYNIFVPHAASLFGQR